MVMLEPIAKQYSIIYDHFKSTQVAKVTTAVPMTKELEEKVLAKVIELTGNKTSIENIVNPSILGDLFYALETCNTMQVSRTI